MNPNRRSTAAPPVRRDEPEYVSVTIRKIDNGYVASHSRSGPKGFEHREVYHAKKPDLTTPGKPMDMGSTKSGVPKPAPEAARKPAKGSAALKSAGGRKK